MPIVNQWPKIDAHLTHYHATNINTTLVEGELSPMNLMNNHTNSSKWWILMIYFTKPEAEPKLQISLWLNGQQEDHYLSTKIQQGLACFVDLQMVTYWQTLRLAVYRYARHIGLFIRVLKTLEWSNSHKSIANHPQSGKGPTNSTRGDQGNKEILVLKASYLIRLWITDADSMSTYDIRESKQIQMTTHKYARQLLETD